MKKISLIAIMLLAVALVSGAGCAKKVTENTVENAIEKFLKARESAGKSVTNVNSMTATIKPSGQDLETGVAVDAVVNTILEQLRAGVTLEIKAKVPDARTSS